MTNDQMNSIADTNTDMAQPENEASPKEATSKQSVHVRHTGDTPKLPSKFKTKVVKTKKESLFTTPMITTAFILHFVLACISFNFHILNLGIPMHQANIGGLLLEILNPLIFALVLAPFLTMARHSEFKEEYKSLLFIGASFSILYSLSKLIGVVG